MKSYFVICSFLLICFSYLLNLHAGGTLIDQTKTSVTVPSTTTIEEKIKAGITSTAAKWNATKAQLQACKTFYEEWIRIYSITNPASEGSFPDFDGVGTMKCNLVNNRGGWVRPEEIDALALAHRACRESRVYFEGATSVGHSYTFTNDIGSCPPPPQSWDLISLETSYRSPLHDPSIMRLLTEKFDDSAGDKWVICMSESAPLAALGCQAELQRREGTLQLFSPEK